MKAQSYHSVLLAALVLVACQDASDDSTERRDRASATPPPVSAEMQGTEPDGSADPGDSAAPASAGAQNGQAGESADTAPATEASPEAQASAGKPSAPIRIDYTVIGTPIVGQPVNINLEVSSSLGNRPVTLNYRINDARNLAFPQAQAQRVALAAPADSGRAAQQVTVVPQREGRLYLNVSAEVETAEGMLMKSMAIPIQVGSAPEQQETNGELQEDADGEAVISMPAEETTR